MILLFDSTSELLIVCLMGFDMEESLWLTRKKSTATTTTKQYKTTTTKIHCSALLWHFSSTLLEALILLYPSFLFITFLMNFQYLCFRWTTHQWHCSYDFASEWTVMLLLFFLFSHRQPHYSFTQYSAHASFISYIRGHDQVRLLSLLGYT